MRSVSIAQLKASLSAHMRHVRAGEVVLITDRGRPVARLVPVAESVSNAEDARLLELERRGSLRRPLVPLAPELLEPPGGADAAASVRAAVAEEREGGF